MSSRGRSEALIHLYLRVFEHVRALKDWRLHCLKLHGHHPHLQQEGSLAVALAVLQLMCRVEHGWILKTASLLNETIHLHSLDWVVFLAWGDMSNRRCQGYAVLCNWASVLSNDKQLPVATEASKHHQLLTKIVPRRGTSRGQVPLGRMGPIGTLWGRHPLAPRNKLSASTEPDGWNVLTIYENSRQTHVW